MGDLLTIRGLTVAGGGGDILRDVDLDLDRGEVLGLVGESGAGKSTLGLAAMGYARDGCRITAGTVDFDGRDLVHLTPAALRAVHGRRIAYVAQSAAAAFNPAHKLIDQFAEAPVLHGLESRAAARREAVELYARMRLPEPETIGFRYPHQVSGGQLQRAMTGMAMSARPELIVFDEPTTALDVTTQIEVLGAIRDVVEDSGTAAIYITHDLAVVAQMADRIMVMRHGAVLEAAPTRRMIYAPQAEYTRTLWAVRELARESTAPPAEAAPLLRVDGVTAKYGAFAALEEVSFDVHGGRTLALVGESGSGKSTMARVIAGLLAPSDGSVLWNGAPLPGRAAKRDRATLRDIQMIYQSADTALNPKQTVAEILGRPMRFFLGLRDEARRRRLRELMEMIELDPDRYLDRRPPELSGGQKQRVGIARALAAEPRLVIADEVTSALDQIVAEGILRLLLRLQAELGLTYMFITHDLATVQAVADEVVVLQHGRVVDKGGREEVFAPPRTAYTRALLDSVPEMDPDWLSSLRRPAPGAG